MSLVVDASVAVKWYVEEDLSDEAVAILDRGERLFAPDLIVAEVANIAWKKAVRGEIGPDQAREIAGGIGRGVPVLCSSAELAGRALALALTLDHPVYDCLYLACAERVDGLLVTADRRLRDAARASGLGVRVGLLGDAAALRARSAEEGGEGP